MTAIILFLLIIIVSIIVSEKFLKNENSSANYFESISTLSFIMIINWFFILFLWLIIARILFWASFDNTIWYYWVSDFIIETIKFIIFWLLYVFIAPILIEFFKKYILLDKYYSFNYNKTVSLSVFLPLVLLFSYLVTIENLWFNLFWSILTLLSFWIKFIILIAIISVASYIWYTIYKMFLRRELLWIYQTLKVNWISEEVISEIKDAIKSNSVSKMKKMYDTFIDKI